MQQTIFGLKVLVVTFGPSSALGVGVLSVEDPEPFYEMARAQGWEVAR